MALGSTTAVFVGCLATTLSGCALRSEPDGSGADGEGALSLQQGSASHLAGSYAFGRSRIAFDAAEVGEGRAVLRVDIDGRRLDLLVDHGEGRYEADGHGAILDAEQGMALQGLAHDLAAWLGGASGALAMHEAALVAIAAYWAESPRGYAFGVRRVLAPAPRSLDPAPASLGNDGISCVRRGQAYSVSYDAKDGAASTELVLAGSDFGYNPENGGVYDCMGRCGGGCAGFSLYGRYTLDCLEHDVCSHRYDASGGGTDPSCGDEFYEAFDDFVLPGWYGCGG